MAAINLHSVCVCVCACPWEEQSSPIGPPVKAGDCVNCWLWSTWKQLTWPKTQGTELPLSLVSEWVSERERKCSPLNKIYICSIFKARTRTPSGLGGWDSKSKPVCSGVRTMGGQLQRGTSSRPLLCTDNYLSFKPWVSKYDNYVMRVVGAALPSRRAFMWRRHFWAVHTNIDNGGIMLFSSLLSWYSQHASDRNN